MNISILLPFKENYSREMAGAVSLFVKDTSIISSFRNTIQIFGSTDSKKFLSKNYINLKQKNNFLKSANKEYVKSFLVHPYLKETEILEIHNRPNYIKQVKQSYNKKIFLYYKTLNVKEFKYLVSILFIGVYRCINSNRYSFF